MRPRTTIPGRAALVLVLSMLPTLIAGSAGASEPASLSGLVTHAASGVGVRDVCVVAFDHTRLEDNEREVRTSLDGSFLVTGLPPGLYSVFVNHRCEGAMPHLAAARHHRVLDVRAGSRHGGIDVALEPAGRLTGRVVDDRTGAGIADVCVGIWDEATHAFGPPTRTDADGRWSIGRLAFLREGESVAVPGGGLPSGAYVLSFEDCRPEPFYVSERHADRTGADAGPWADPVWVPSGTVVSVETALTLGGAVVGQITGDHSGAPVKGCVGLWSGASEEPWLVSATGEASGGSPGSYSFSGLPPGTYSVAFEPEVCGDGALAAEWWDDAIDRSNATPIVLPPGSVVRSDASVAPRPASPADCPADASQRASLRFDDITAAHPHARSIGCLLARGAVSGTARHTFTPAAPITRAQAATILATALGQAGLLEGVEPSDAFRDDDGSVHEPALDLLAAAGIVLGREPGRADPSSPLTRAQAASLLVRAYEQVTSVSLRAGTDRFHDDDGSVHAAAIERAALAGLVAGRAPGRYVPEAQLTRAQAATMVGNLLGRVERDLVGDARG